MVQYIKQGNIFGRIGENLGKGLAEQLPEEITRGRLRHGLQQFEKDAGNLTPVQQGARLAAIPGITPQTQQTLGELARFQALRQQFNRNRSAPQPGNANPQLPPNIQAQVDAINSGALSSANAPNRPMSNVSGHQEPGENVSAYETGQPQVGPQNPLREQTKTVRPMTPQEKIDDIAQLGEEFQGLTYPELKAMSDENERRRQAQPEAERAEDARLREVKERLRTGFKSLLEQKLQKTDKGTYEDLTGEMQNNLVRSMEKDLRSNPRLTEDDVINKWTQKGLDLAKAKTSLEGKLGSSWFATPIILNKSEYRKELEDIADVYRKAGNSEEFYKTLRAYGFSPRGAGSLTYKMNPKLSESLRSAQKGKNLNPTFNASNSRKIATDVESLITPQDSILSIANELLLKDPNFDLRNFLDQLREDKDQIGFTPRQQRELSEAGHLSPSWPDILVLPWR